MIPRHGRKRSASPSILRRSSNDDDTSAKKLKANKRSRSASPSTPHRSLTNSNRSAKKSKPSPIPSPAPVESGSTEKKNQLAHKTVNHRRTRRPPSSLPHRPPIDNDRLANKSKTTHSSGDTIQVLPEKEKEEGVSKHDNDHYPVPSLPPVDSVSTDSNQQDHTGILPTLAKPHKRKHEVILNLPHRPKPKLEMPAAKRRRLPQKTAPSVFSEPKSDWNQVYVGWDFGGPPSWGGRVGSAK